MLLKGKTVFIVEDNQTNLNIALIYLQREGAKVHFCRRATGITSKIAEVLPVDIILMDLMFPHNVSGFDIFRELRSTSGLEDVPVVAISASDPDVAMRRAIELGFTGYIAKPISCHLAKQVADVLCGKPVWVSDVNGGW